MASEVEPRVGYQVDVKDVEYQRQGDRPFLARIYQPRGEGQFPTVIDIHGGAWADGDRTRDAAIDQPLAESGVVVVALDFRVSGDEPHPAALQDINLGIRWAKAHAAELHGTSEVGILGASSGGHQALLSAILPTDERFTVLPLEGHADLDARVKYVVVCWPVSDPLARHQLALKLKRHDLIEKALLNFGWEAGMAEASPQYVLERGEQQAMPPVLLVHGRDDAQVTMEIQERFIGTYSMLGGSIEADYHDGVGHAFIGQDPTSEQSRAAVASIIRFVHGQN